MADRNWYYALDGKPQGPFSEEQLRGLIQRGEVRHDTLVWTETLQGWTQAGAVPGLLQSRPPALPPGVPQAATARHGVPAAPATDYPGGEPGAPMLLTAGPFALFGRGLLVAIGQFLVIPSPWVITAFYRWFVTKVQLPNNKALTFTGKAGEIWYIFMLNALCGLAGIFHFGLQLLLLPLVVLFTLITIRWFFGHLAWQGQRERLRFSGGYWPLLGWWLLMWISIISIVGWAWVGTAWMRWTCRHVEGSSKKLSFVGSGWAMLWRTLVFGISCIFIIPIPWTMRWYARWIVSRCCLSERA